MAKIREYKDIKTEFDPSGKGFIIKHLTGDTTIPQNGAWLVNIPCGGGKSTSIISLVLQKANTGILLETPTIKDANQMKENLLLKGSGILKAQDIIVLHHNSSDFVLYQHDPEIVTTKKIIITTHIRQFIDPLSLLLAYDQGKKVDISAYMGMDGVKKLLQSDNIRRFWLIDELPTFIQPFLEFEKNILSGFSYPDNIKTGGVPDCRNPKSYWHCKDLSEMEQTYNQFFKDYPVAFWKSKTPLNTYREQEGLADINQNYKSLMKNKSSKLQIWQFLHNFLPPVINTNILIYDGTADIIRKKKNTSKIRLAGCSGRSYCSPISFERFCMPVERWLFGKGIDEPTLIKELIPLIDELERQIRQLNPGEKILLIAWMYAVIRELDPDNNKVIHSKRYDIITIIQQELDQKGFAGRYEIIYRGSGLDKGSNKFQDFAAVSFIGEWSAGKEGLKLINQNFGTKCPMRQYRVSMMVQAICRIRIRQHKGKPIKVFYSDDIEPRLMEEVYHYFVKNSDTGLAITGVPVAPKTVRTSTFIEKIQKLCAHDPAFYDAIRNRTPYILNIKLKDIRKIIPMKERRSRAYNRLIKDIQQEYGVTLQVG